LSPEEIARIKEMKKIELIVEKEFKKDNMREDIENRIKN
jgi:hypothetical protein